MHSFSIVDKIYAKRTFIVLFFLFLLWGSVQLADGFGIHIVSSKFTPELKAAERGELSLITYNIAGLPQIISSAVTKRSVSIGEIGRRLNNYDIVHVQEDFNYNKNLYDDGNVHPYRTQTKGGVPFGDGLNTLSRYPIRDIRRISWNDCTGADCLTPKGFTYSRIEVAKDVFIDFYNVHTNAYNHLPAAAARRANVRQLSWYINKHSAGNAVIVMGDLNGHYNYHYDNIPLLINENELKDVWVELKQKGNIPVPLKQLPDSDILHLADSTETIDKVFYRSSAQITLKPSGYNVESELFTTTKGLPLSDHHPVSAKFSWNLNRQETISSAF
ncbi:endonuclease/exonuclease/phosphatase family protein [Dyadobacter bucti]|uniref:endonuclease/exonuclease/phosphatase family protein n=1 Tax=Dyadobacter bucti TaxID=2572203 RepID=UPI003F721F3D